MTLLRGNKEEKNMRRQVKVEKNNRQTNKQVWGLRAFPASNGMRTRPKLSY